MIYAFKFVHDNKQPLYRHKLYAFKFCKKN